jgi:hypothetical protein
MKKPGALVRVAAVSSSVLLVSMLVAYRAGALDSLLASTARLGTMGGSKSYQVLHEEFSKPSEEVPTDSLDSTMMGGSKSVRILDISPGKPDGDQPAIMYSSKSSIIIDPSQKKPGAKSPAPGEPSRPSP